MSCDPPGYSPHIHIGVCVDQGLLGSSGTPGLGGLTAAWARPSHRYPQTSWPRVSGPSVTTVIRCSRDALMPHVFTLGQRGTCWSGWGKVERRPGLKAGAAGWSKKQQKGHLTTGSGTALSGPQPQAQPWQLRVGRG